MLAPTAGLLDLLDGLRRRRRADVAADGADVAADGADVAADGADVAADGADVDLIAQGKVALLAALARRDGLRAVVVGVSGGVDSAAVLALCAQVARLPQSPLQRVVAALLPVDVVGATGQDRALAAARAVVAVFADVVTPVVVPLQAAHAALDDAVAAGLSGVTTDARSPWARGQLVSTIRTPALYHLVTRLTDAGLPACVVGTTNRDEGAFLGFFGKASDGMVDVQLLGDLHKSEVRNIARRLGVPAAIIDAEPTGDTFDGATDASMIGTTYDMVELLARLRERPDRDALIATLDDDSRRTVLELDALLQARHARNHHKYRGASPALFLDVLPRAIPGGWRHEPLAPKPPRDERAFVGRVVGVDLVRFLDSDAVKRAVEHAGERVGQSVEPVEHAGFGDSVVIVDGLLTAAEAARLRELVLPLATVPVDAHGRPAVGNTPVAGHRCSVVDEAFADRLWQRLQGALPPLRVVDEHTPTDHDDHPVWRPVGLNPYLRVLRADASMNGTSLLVPHHDSTFDDGSGEQRTLMSVVITLPAPQQAGSTRFLVDDDRFIPVRGRTFADAATAGEAPGADDSDVIATVEHRPGRAIVFDHRLRHDAPPWHDDEPRLVLRTDVLFVRCGARALSAPAPRLWPVALPEGAVASSSSSARWKRVIHRDPFLGPAVAAAVARGDDPVAFALGTGFFDDGSDRDHHDDLAGADAGLLTTPLQPFVDALPPVDDGRPLVVMVLPGALAPVHEGHLALMALAKQALEGRGCCVLGGILAPDHDGYVRTKLDENHRHLLDAGARVELAAAAAVDVPWLVVDPWAATVADRALNYTDVVFRTARTLNRHLATARPIHVVLVCGGDNARFALTFTGSPGTIDGVPRVVVVARAGHADEVARVRACPGVHGDPRLVFVDATPPDAASRRVRAGELSSLPPTARERWRRRREQEAPPGRVQVWLRDEGEACWPPHLLQARAAGVDVEGLLRIFTDDVVTALSAAGVDEVSLVTVVSQQEAVAVRLARHRSAGGPLIVSLDPCLRGDVDLGVSRVFQQGDTAAVRKVPAILARPGHPDLDVQLREIAADGRSRAGVVLLDDDRATGSTLAAVTARLRSLGVDVVDVVCALELAHGPERDEVVDVVDRRDVLLGAKDGGLVVQLPGRAGPVRVPSLLPWVPPSSRLPLSPSMDVALSLALWRANARLLARLPTHPTLQDTPGLLALARLQRVPPSTSLLRFVTRLTASLAR